MVNKMSVTNIMRNEESFLLKDEGSKGFVIETEDLCYYSDFTGCAYVRFKCFDDYSKYFYIDCWSHCLYSEKCYRNSKIRNNERMFYNIFKEIEKLVDQCKPIEEEHMGYTIIINFFEGIHEFMREYKLGFKHNNKKIEKKFYKKTKKLKS